MTEAIEHVSDTAVWVAYYRWVETQRKDPLFRDPLALKLIGDRGTRLAKHMGIQKAMRWSMALRTYIIDQYIQEAIESGIDMVVNLGAGLDTRPYRLDLKAEIQWFEVDFPDMITYKNEMLKDDVPACKLTRIACDLSEGSAREALLADLNALGRSILVLTEGVVPYLTNEDVAALADNLNQKDHIIYWLSDYFSPLFNKVSARGRVKARLAKNAPFRFDPGPQPLDWPTFFAAHGWEIDAMRYVGEVGRQLGRDLPANWLLKMLMRFAPEERLRPYRRMNGYALLKKGNTVVPL